MVTLSDLYSRNRNLTEEQLTLLNQLDVGQEYSARNVLTAQVNGGAPLLNYNLGYNSTDGLLDSYCIKPHSGTYLTTDQTNCLPKSGQFDWSISTLIYLETDFSSQSNIFFPYNADNPNSDGNRLLSINVYPNGRVESYTFPARTTSSYQVASSAIGAVTTGNWFMLTVTYKSDTGLLSIFKDITLIASATISVNHTTGNVPIEIGRRATSSISTALARMQYWYKFNKRLTSKELEFLYNNGSYRFLSSITDNNADITPIGYRQSLIYNSSADRTMYLAGTSKPALSFPATTEDTMTFGIWIKPDAILGTEQIIISCSSFYATTQTDFPLTFAILSSGALVLHLDSGNDYSHDLVVTTTSNLIKANVWQHVGFILNRATNTATIYINGVPVMSSSNYTFNLPSNGRVYQIGTYSLIYSQTDNFYFVGYISEAFFQPGTADVNLLKAYANNFNYTSKRWSVTNGMILFLSSVNSRIALSGTNVTAIEDRSDSFNYATYSSNFPVLDGKFIRGCLDTSSALFSHLRTDLLGTSLSFFIRIRNQTDATTQTRVGPTLAIRPFSGSVGGAAHWWLGLAVRRDGNNLYGYAGTNTGLLLTENTLPAITNNTEYLLTYIKTPTEWKVYRDGVLALTVADTSESMAGNYPPTLFADPVLPTSYYTVNNHAFSHIVVYNRTVSESERIQIEKDINDGKKL